MPGLKRPNLPDGGLKDLNTALHDLHRRAGRPSTRDLAKLIGPRVASKSRVYDAFSSDRLPSWGLIQVLAEALCEFIPGSAFSEEEQRLHGLWLAATGADDNHAPSSQLSAERTIPSEIEAPTPAPVLALRIEWARPSDLSVQNRRALRFIVTDALSDIGYGAEGAHRRDMSAGSVISVDARREDPSLTTATVLATLEDSLHSSGIPGGYRGSTLRLLAHLGPCARPTVLDAQAQAIEELNELWRHQKTQDLFKNDQAVSAILADALLNLDRYDPFLVDWEYAQVPLFRVDRGPQDLGNYKLWVRTRADRAGGRVGDTPPF
ncbi:hypothetical protein OG393_22595 [Streptomyces sp. NBC_01216]|uniref:hypothetical protein n=1 Tax=Streptomyces sp. NBC_01216 TaxID=2903778 RepID=UPI002E13EDDC|nr:hypothetical protein OG393_22595 [Streptomyces sp. NBC_01216]